MDLPRRSVLERAMNAGKGLGQEDREQPGHREGVGRWGFLGHCEDLEFF